MCLIIGLKLTFKRQHRKKRPINCKRVPFCYGGCAEYIFQASLKQGKQPKTNELLQALHSCFPSYTS